MGFLHVDLEKCIHCGRCAEDCVTGAIALNDEGPQVVLDYCIACGHCVAICPTEALDNEHCPLSKQEPYGGGRPDSAAVAEILRARRSIRCYENKAVPRELAEKLLDMARFAPTGGNSQGIGYLAIDDRKTLDAVILSVIEWIEDEIAKNSPYGPFMKNFTVRYREQKRDTILWDAPCLLLARPHDSRPIFSARENAIYAFLYAQLYAPSLGLGTCWSGLVEMCIASRHPAILKVLRPYGEPNFVAAMMLGYPKYDYHRLADRDPLNISWL